MKVLKSVVAAAPLLFALPVSSGVRPIARCRIRFCRGREHVSLYDIAATHSRYNDTTR